MSEMRRSIPPKSPVCNRDIAQPSETCTQFQGAGLPVSSGEVGASALSLDLSTGPRLDTDVDLAKRALGNVGADVQDALLASIETRLADEVLGLVRALREFAGRAQCIGVEMPERAHFSKTVASFLSLIGFQFADALAKSLDRSILFDDGAQYLGELGLSLEDFFREVDLNGRRFLAVALIDKAARHGASDGKDADKCADVA
jgi:hypothetical protein